MSYLDDAGHAMVIGVTGGGASDTPYGGKSVLANWWHDNAVSMGWKDVSVFFNAKPTNGIRGKRVSSLRGVAEAYKEGERKFNYIPTGETEAAHEGVVDFLTRLPGDKILINDEAQDYQDSLGPAVKKGSGSSMKNLVVMQRGWDVHDTIRSQVVWDIWIGPFSSKYEQYFDTELTEEAKAHVQQNHGPYQWSVFDAGGGLVEFNKPVPRGYA